MGISTVYDPYLEIAKSDSEPIPSRRNTKRERGKMVSVRTEAKINRNEICPKCDSGLKYKKCCAKN